MTGFYSDRPVNPANQQELKELAAIEQDFFSFVLPWLKLIPEGASVPLEEVRSGLKVECVTGFRVLKPGFEFQIF
jgi:hypothetical protein